MTSSRTALVLALAVAALLAILSVYRPPMELVWADEGTYLGMAESLVRDGDLRFDERDLERLEGAERGRGTVILQRSPEGVVAYSKPILFSLLAAPFYALAGGWGIAALNALLLALALGFAWRLLSRLGPPGRAALVLVSFAGAAVIVPYVFWRMSDSMQASLALIGGCLSFAQLRQRENGGTRSFVDRCLDHRSAPFVGAALLGLVVSMRVSNGTLALVPPLAALLARRFRRSVGLALAAALAFGAVTLLTALLTGTSNPYRSARTSFTPAVGYPAGPGAEAALERFDERPARVHTGAEPPPGLSRVPYAALYFLIGRHTGVLFYFPALLALLPPLLRRFDPAAVAGLVGFGAMAVFLVGWLPWNYFGGSTFLGNRYLLPAYALLPAVLPRLPRLRWLVAAWALAAVSYGSALTAEVGLGERDASGQGHALAGIFRALPYESTAQHLFSRDDRYWSGDFLRFTDDFAEVCRWHFELAAGERPAEILIAQWRPAGKVRFLVTTDTPRAALVVSDRGFRERWELGTENGPRSRWVEFEPSPPWRHHVFWWDLETVYHARTLRFALEAPDDPSAVARLRYFGEPETLEETFACERLSARVPERAVAGSSSAVHFAVRNTSRRIWEREDVVPVEVRVRLLGAGGELAADEWTFELPGRVLPGEVLEMEIAVEWPETPGVYHLEVDLVLSRVATFAQRLGSPLVSREVEVSVQQIP